MSSTPIIDSLIEELVADGTIPKYRKQAVVGNKRPQHLVMTIRTTASKEAKADRRAKRC